MKTVLTTLIVLMVLGAIVSAARSTARSMHFSMGVLPFERAEIGLGWQGGYFPTYVPPPEQVKIFDDSVFNLNKRKHRPTYSHEGRFLDERPDFSETQRSAWIQKCKQLEKYSFSKFQICFEQELQNYEKDRAQRDERDAAMENHEMPRRLDPYPY